MLFTGKLGEGAGETDHHARLRALCVGEIQARNTGDCEAWHGAWARAQILQINKYIHSFVLTALFFKQTKSIRYC